VRQLSSANPDYALAYSMAYPDDPDGPDQPDPKLTAIVAAYDHGAAPISTPGQRQTVVASKPGRTAL